MTTRPTGVALKVTDKQGNVSFPSYEAWGWDKVNEIILATWELENVASVEIAGVNIEKVGV
jgi:hypothetical protein